METNCQANHWPSIKFILLPVTQPGAFDSAFSHAALCIGEESVLLVREARKTAASFFGKHTGAWGSLTIRGSLYGIALEYPIDGLDELFEEADASEEGIEITKAVFDRLAEAKGAHSLDCAGFAVSEDRVEFVGYGKHHDGEIEGRVPLDRHFFKGPTEPDPATENPLPKEPVLFKRDGTGSGQGA